MDTKPPNQLPAILSGGVLITGDEIFINLSSTHDGSPENWRCAETSQLRLNISTLNGTGWTVGNCYEGQVNPDYTSGTATLTKCQ
jgi:hypothetical protein